MLTGSVSRGLFWVGIAVCVAPKGFMGRGVMLDIEGDWSSICRYRNTKILFEGTISILDNTPKVSLGINMHKFYGGVRAWRAKRCSITI